LCVSTRGHFMKMLYINGLDFFVNDCVRFDERQRRGESLTCADWVRRAGLAAVQI
jgi:hypothetical protein